jgi:hypothetical protein
VECRSHAKRRIFLSFTGGLVRRHKETSSVEIVSAKTIKDTLSSIDQKESSIEILSGPSSTLMPWGKARSQMIRSSVGTTSTPRILAFASRAKHSCEKLSTATSTRNRQSFAFQRVVTSVRKSARANLGLTFCRKMRKCQYIWGSNSIPNHNSIKIDVIRQCAIVATKPVIANISRHCVPVRKFLMNDSSQILSQLAQSKIVLFDPGCDEMKPSIISGRD